MQKILLLFFIIISLKMAAQTPQQKIAFTSINSIGTVWGSSQNVVVFETINGISYKKWSVGLGIAFDGYGQQSTPIFLDIRKTIDSKNKLFIYADAGINMPWRTISFPEKYTSSNTPAFQLKNTFYGEFGFGLKTPINTQTSFIASIGYSYKTFSYTQLNVNSWWLPQIADKSQNFDFYYKRIAFRLGIQF